jgi:hypothetical protein
MVPATSPIVTADARVEVSKAEPSPPPLESKKVEEDAPTKENDSK